MVKKSERMLEKIQLKAVPGEYHLKEKTLGYKSEGLILWENYTACLPEPTYPLSTKSGFQSRTEVMLWPILKHCFIALLKTLLKCNINKSNEDSENTIYITENPH